MPPSVGHPSIFLQSAQVSNPFSRTQLCTGQSLSQNGVLAPSMRQPVQLIISGKIVTPLSCVHRAAVFSRRALSFVIVAILASQVSQSSPQQPISWFVFFIVASTNLIFLFYNFLALNKMEIGSIFAFFALSLIFPFACIVASSVCSTICSIANPAFAKALT